MPELNEQQRSDKMGFWTKIYTWISPFERYDTNPYNYRCRLCGQSFITLGYWGMSWNDRLVSSKSIIKSDCRCHKCAGEDMSWFRGEECLN